MMELARNQPEKINSENNDTLQVENGSIEFQNVSMRYKADLEPALQGCTFKIKPGERIAIVGRTGSGKSSLI